MTAKMQKSFRIAVFLVAGFAGCVEKGYQFNMEKRTPQESALVTLKSSDADLRYKTLMELANSKAFREDWSVRAMIVVVQTDPSNSVRALAVHNLGRIADQRVVGILTEALGDDDERVRAEAAWGLAQFPVPGCGAEPKLVTDAQRQLIKAVTDDSNVDARLNSARSLGEFKDRPVLVALITALKDSEFSVRYEAHRSLVKLTGMTFHANVDQWLAWSQKTSDPFKNAGQVPPELAEPKRNAFQRAGDDLYRFYVDWQGPSKR